MPVTKWLICKDQDIFEVRNTPSNLTESTLSTSTMLGMWYLTLIVQGSTPESLFPQFWFYWYSVCYLLTSPEYVQTRPLLSGLSAVAPDKCCVIRIFGQWIHAGQCSKFAGTEDIHHWANARPLNYAPWNGQSACYVSKSSCGLSTTS